MPDKSRGGSRSGREKPSTGGEGGLIEIHLKPAVIGTLRLAMRPGVAMVARGPPDLNSTPRRKRDIPSALNSLDHDRRPCHISHTTPLQTSV